LKKIILIITILIFTQNLFSQEIHSEYLFKKEKVKSRFLSNGIKWNYSELDSLVLFKNGSFYRKRFYHYHEINYSEQKGDWKIDNGILYLNSNQEKTSKTDTVWNEINEKYEFLIKKRKLIPTVFEYFKMTRKLKWI
jgi:hypothetical protein